MQTLLHYIYLFYGNVYENHQCVSLKGQLRHDRSSAQISSYSLY